MQCPPGGEAPRHHHLEPKSRGADGPVRGATGGFNADSPVVTGSPTAAALLMSCRNQRQADIKESKDRSRWSG